MSAHTLSMAGVLGAEAPQTHNRSGRLRRLRRLIVGILASGLATVALAAPTGPDLQPSKLTVPNSTTLPATCAVGQVYIDTDASPAASRLYSCTATNTWTSMGAGSSTPGGSTTQLQYNNAGAFGGLSWWIVNNGSTYSTMNGKLRIGDTTAPDFALEVAGSGLGLVGRGISGTGATPSFSIEGAAGGLISFEAPNVASNSDYRIGDISGGSYSAGYLLSVRSSSLAACVDNMIQRNNSSGGIQLECISDSPTINDSGTIVTTASVGLSTDQIQDRASGGLLIAPAGTLTIKVTGAAQGVSITPGPGGNTVVDSVSDLNMTNGGVINASNGTLRIYNGGTEPSTCTVGDVFQDTSLAVGGQWKLCTSANTWTVQGGAAPGGSDTYIQYKSGTSLAGDANFTWTAGSQRVNVGREIAVGDSPSGGTSNMVNMLDNDVNYAPDPTCAASGTAGSTTWIEVNEAAGDTYCFCDGTTQVFCYAAATGLAVGAGTDTDFVLSFDQGTGTDPTLTWDDSESAVVAANLALVYAQCAAQTVAASAITANGCNVVTVNGPALSNLDTVNTCNTAQGGRVLIILCADTDVTIRDASTTGTGNIEMGTAVTCSANTTVVTLVCSGASGIWYKTSGVND